MKRITALAIAAMLTVALVWAQGPTQFHPGFNLFTKAQDVQVGQANAAMVRRQMPIIRDPFLNAYVTHVGKRLVSAREAQESGFPFTFEVVADPSINAFALPGGPMFINTGLLRAVDNEAQLAGVMGHEMSHVILRHGTNQASKSRLIELPAVLGSQMAGNSMMGSLGYRVGCQQRSSQVFALRRKPGRPDGLSSDGGVRLQPDGNGAFL